MAHLLNGWQPFAPNGGAKGYSSAVTVSGDENDEILKTLKVANSTAPLMA